METELTNGSLNISLVDVGGKRSERKKWGHCFDNVNGVLFMVAMSDYDQISKEDGKTNRMAESIKLFSRVCNNLWFEKAAMFLFLNKKDVFDEKIKHSPLTKCFPQYKGDEDMHSPEDFISEEFVKQVKPDREIYRHFTCAKDSRIISPVFEVGIDLIREQNLKDCGMF